jgi:hypothetical protein
MVILLRKSRRGLSAVEVVLVTAIGLSMAATLYWLFERSIGQFYASLSNAVGWPFL